MKVLCTQEHLDFTRASLKTCAWRRAMFDRLLQRCADDTPTPTQAARLGLAFHLTGQAQYRQRARQLLQRIGDGYSRRPKLGDMDEATYISWFACAYDLATPEEDFSPVIAEMMATLDANPHRTCSNHNTWNIRARLSLAAATGDQAGIDAVLHGKDGRYGFIHQLRHDLLADGMEWEHNLRHHFLTLEVYADIADRCRNLGIDLWHQGFPAALKDDGADLHTDYGPPGEKCLKAAFDAPLYQMFPNGDFSLFGDSRLSNVRGVAVWGVMYHLAYQAYRDPRHAWLIRQLGDAWRETPTADLDFVRVLDNDWPAGECPWERDTDIGLTGKHRGGSTLLPSTGSTMLRAGDYAAFVFWGAHSGGHQGPGALNLELYAGGQRVTDAPWSASFDDPLHLEWCRTTIAHNTVTVDETPMFPYHEPSESIWQMDYWQKRSSAGELVEFRPDFVHVANERVYPGVRLERAVTVSPANVLDVFDCISAEDHVYDWAIHFPADLLPCESEPVALSYRQLRETRVCREATFFWQFPHGRLQAQVETSVPAQMIIAKTPEPTGANGFPGSDHNPTRACSTLIVRCRARAVKFSTRFTFQP